MIEKIGFQNFRVFRDYQEFELKPITLLTGTNNSGKSSIQKFLLLLKNSIRITADGTAIFDKLFFPEDISNQIGNFDNNISFGSEDKSLRFSFICSDYGSGKITTTLIYEKSSNLYEADLTKIEIQSELLGDFSLVKKEPDPKKQHTDYNNEESYWQFEFSQSVDVLSDILYKLIRNFKEGLLIYNHLLEYQGLNSPDALSLMKKFEDKRYKKNFHPELGLEFGTIWDSEDQRVVSYNCPGDWYEHRFSDQSKVTVFSTFLTHLVLGETNLLGSEIKDEKLQNLKSLLALNNIFSKEDFLNEYKKFEKHQVKTQIKELQELTMFDNTLSPLNPSCVRFNNVIEKDENPYHRREKDGSMYDEKVYSGVIDNILDSKEYRKCFPNEIIITKPKSKKKSLLKILEEKGYKSHRDVLILPNTAEDEIYDLDLEYKNIGKFILKYLLDFRSDLNRLLLDLEFFSQQYKFPRYFLFNEHGLKDKPLYQYVSLVKLNKYTGSIHEEFINVLLEVFNLGKSLEVTPIKTEDTIIGYSFSLLKEGQLIPLHANGLGGTKIIALILKLAFAKYGSTIILEEPESNLHPAYQSKMADIVTFAYKYLGIKFIVETHSEYFIRKFQYLVANKTEKLRADDLAIHYLYCTNSIPHDKMQVERLEMRPDGILKQDFGEGFFDENARLTMDLLKLQNQN
ncbi:MAG: AAA family ATPase [Bacteroidales bacterium]|nr:AAA family ATPase [Bacteroidales bacterium]